MPGLTECEFADTQQSVWLGCFNVSCQMSATVFNVSDRALTLKEGSAALCSCPEKLPPQGSAAPQEANIA